jgi:hypothetical protein
LLRLNYNYYTIVSAIYSKIVLPYQDNYNRFKIKCQPLSTSKTEKHKNIF